jgi:hypothetical protein
VLFIVGPEAQEVSMDIASQLGDTPRPTQTPVILVHGTWGRGFFSKKEDEGSYERRPSDSGTRWFEKDSQFRKELDGQLKLLSLPFEYSIRSFLWSGANSVFARDRAATKLAEELKNDLQNPSAAPIIVAHSHGGNVALRALSRLGADASRIRIVTLATPFLRVFARDSSKVPVIVWLLLWAAISGISAAPLMLVIMLLSVASTALTGISIVGNDTFMFWLIGGLALAVFASIFIVSWLTGYFLTSGPKSQTAGSSRAHDIENAASYSVIDASGPRMLVIRGADDEASLSLAAGSIGSRLSSLFFFRVIPRSFVFGFFLLAFINWASLLSKERIELLTLVVTNSSCFALLALLFLPGICKSAFGREFLTTAFVCEIATDSTPDTQARVDAITLSPIETAAGLRLRHFIYEHPKCVNEIVRWIREVL